MKPYLRYPLPFLALIIALASPLFVASTCNRQLDPAGPYAGNSILATADSTILTSFDSLHAFVKWEFTNGAALAQWPQIKTGADVIRANVATWRDAVISARDAYKGDPSATNRTKLQAAIDVVRSALSTAISYQNAHKNLPTP